MAESHLETAQKLGRDEFGHFLKVGKEDDDKTLVDVKVNNPLHKIVELLQEIKNQKAFSFSIKGSVGIIGVGAVLVVTGIFGGNKILCDKGVQTKIGQVRVLSFIQTTEVNPLKNKVLTLLGRPYQSTTTNLIILIDGNQNTIQLTSNSQSYLVGLAGHDVVATGNFNSCIQELKVATGGLEDF